MTSSNTLKKIITIGAAALLAISGSLTATTPASAAAATTAPVVSSPALVGNTVSATPGVWPSGTATGKWYVCDSFGSSAAATSVPSGCDALYTTRLDTTPFTTTTLTVPSIAYCANICTPFGNSSTAFKVRWIELNGSDISASAAVAIQDGRSLSLQNPTVGATSVTLGVSNGCNFASSSLSGFADFTLLVGGSSRTISSVNTSGGNVVLNFSGALTSGQSISVTYTQATDAVISCGPSAFIRNTTSALTGTVTSGGGGGGGGGMPPSGGTVTTAPTTPVVTAGIASVTQGTWAGAVSLIRSWRLCDTAITASSGSYMASPPQLPPSSNCKYITTNPLNGVVYTSSDLVSTNPLTVPANVNVVTSCVAQQNASSLCTTTSTATAGKFLVWYEFDNGVWTITASVAADGSGSSQSQQQNNQQQNNQQNSSNEPAPTPAIIAPLLPAISAINRPMISLGGQVALSSGDFNGLTSAKIDGKSLDFILGKTGNLTFTVPNGEAGKTADLLLTFTTGTVNLQNAIKYVAPVVVADVPERPVSIVPGSKKLSEATADQVRAAAFANMTNTSVSCVAYATSNTAAAKAAAIASANAVCALATKANPNLTAAPITVVVDKVKARKVGVGIKVYKATK